MPLLRKAILKPDLGLDYSQPAAYLDLRRNFPQNMRVQRGLVRKREGTKELSASTISGANGIVGMVTYPTEEEAIRLLRTSKTKLEMYNTATDDWDDKTGGGDFSGGDENYFDFTVAENKLIGTNFINVPWTYTDGDAARAALGGSPPKFKYCEYMEPYLVVAYTDAASQNHLKVQWPDTGDITDWASGNADSKLLSHDNDMIRGLKNLNEFCAAYKKNAIYLGRKVDTSDVIKWDLVEVGTGLMNHRCVIEHQGFHYFMAVNDFRVFNGVRSESIGKDVRELVFNSRNANKDSSHWALHMLDYDEIWFFMVPASGTYPTKVYKFNYRHGFWYEDTCPNYRAGAVWFNQAGTLINDLVGKINEQANFINDYLSTTNAPTYAVGDNSGQALTIDRTTSNDNGVLVDAWVDSLDFVADTFERNKRWLQLDFWAKGNYVEIYYSTDEGDSWQSLSTVTLDGDMRVHRVYFDVVSEKIRFRFRNKTAGSTFWLQQFYPYYLVRGEQKA